MTTIAVETVHDVHGAQRTVVTQHCDGPGCDRIKSNDPDFGNWGSLLGFVDVDGTTPPPRRRGGARPGPPSARC